MTKEEILKEIADYKKTNKSNLMGCNEDWYDAYYSIGETFSQDELNTMTEKELNNLVKLANNISEGLY